MNYIKYYYIVCICENMIWGVYIEIYILWEFGYLIDSPFILYIYCAADGKKCIAEYGVRTVVFTDRDGNAVWHGNDDSGREAGIAFLCTFLFQCRFNDAVVVHI